MSPILWQVVAVYWSAITTQGCITVNFLTGAVSKGLVSPVLAGAIAAFPDAVSKLCSNHGGSLSDFQRLEATYWAGHLRRVTVCIEDKLGNRSSDEYAGVPAARVKSVDALGRARKFPTQRG
ncbi:MAG: hypothetical protein JSR99_13065 [Proteobacteria bacterium]|nr:hypothetical protein [Pseudomonadota bacterium]